MEKDKIEVGEYIRTKDNTIDRIADIRLCVSGRTLISFEKSNTCRSDIGIEKYILKHSKNIIDLIEVGDYVNGNRVIAINCNFEYIDDDSDTGVAETDEGVQTTGENIINDEFIKTIVTKEQFKEMEYRV